MKKFIFTFIAMLSFLVFTLPIRALAVESSNNQTVTIDNHTAREEVEGREIWEKLQSKQLECKNLTDDNFDVLGEYFMGQSIGNTERHIVMNEMMKRMMGEKGEEQAHTAMGKRLSGCNTSAAFPSQDAGFLPMMGMMGSVFAPWGFGGTKGGGNPMMGNYFGNNLIGWGFMPFGWIFMLAFWGLIIWVIFSLIRGSRGNDHMCGHDHDAHEKEKSPLEILKERYAKGEIDKKEFEEMKRDIS